MSLRTILSGALLLGSLMSVTASPIIDPAVAKAHQVEPSHNSTLATADHEVYCKQYTYENHNSNASPLIEDYQQLARNIDKDGKWTVWDGPQAQLAQYGTCAFGVQPTDSRSTSTQYHVGNGDIITTITESIKQFGINGINGIIGAAGTMDCRRLTPWWDGWDTKVEYGIYHT